MLTRELTLDHHRRFIERVAASELVWGIQRRNGYAHAISNEVESDDFPDGVPVLLFWSDRAYAARAQRESYPDGVVTDISLFDFLYRWLPGMSDDGIFVGTNWTGDLIGIETEPVDLQAQLFRAIGEERVSTLRARVKAALSESE